MGGKQASQSSWQRWLKHHYSHFADWAKVWPSKRICESSWRLPWAAQCPTTPTPPCHCSHQWGCQLWLRTLRVESHCKPSPHPFPQILHSQESALAMPRQKGRFLTPKVQNTSREEASGCSWLKWVLRSKLGSPLTAQPPSLQWLSSSHLYQGSQMWVPEITCLNPYSDIKIVGHHLKVAKQPLLMSELTECAKMQRYHLQTWSDTTSGKQVIPLFPKYWRNLLPLSTWGWTFWPQILCALVLPAMK